MNEVSEKLTGWSEDDAQGKPIEEVYNAIYEVSRKKCRNCVRKIFESGSLVKPAENSILISRDGKEQLIEESCAPIKNKKNALIGVVLIFRDITEKNRMAKNIQRSEKLKSLATIAGGIAHDFNNLLNGIFGYIELALSNTTYDSLVYSYLNKSLGVFKNAKNLTQQLLTFSKGGTPVFKTGDFGLKVKDSSSFVLSGSSVQVKYFLHMHLKGPCS